ncbi:MAG: phosphoribosyl-ATP diphosphatase [Alphaproteobacteria bacterium]
MSDAQVIDRLHATVLSRRGASADSSYTARLFAQGRAKIAAKLGEEAVETVIAGTSETPERLASESADLLYHLVVLWAERGVAPADVWAELARREGTSGLDEKAARGKA